jgi:cobyrinic acid a,c-diamide synthase
MPQTRMSDGNRGAAGGGVLSLSCPRIVVAATASGVGKTSVSIALTAALRRRSLRVQTFKAGPDFLDPTWLSLASGRSCYNLDGWMCGRDYVETLFTRATRGADIALIEGVMGLFDGADPVSIEGSTAELARWLDAPVLLLVSAQGAARSLAATVAGFAAFEQGVKVAGVIANPCGSERHAEWLSESLRAAGLPPLAGALARGSLPSIPSRHLGLMTAEAGALPAEALDRFAAAAERHLSLDAICELAHTAPSRAEARQERRTAEPVVRIGLAQDAAFHFYYPDNLEALEAAGCALVRFSPLADSSLPDGLDGLYIGGGYPEEHAATLAANASMIESVRCFAASGRPIYAECGGLMYLSRGIETLDGLRHGMVDLLPPWTRMLPRRKALGYVEASPCEDSFLAPRGDCLRGHEFHYSELAGPSGDAAPWRPAYRTRRRRETAWTQEGFRRGNIQASYVHIHFASHPGAAQRFARICQESRP